MKLWNLCNVYSVYGVNATVRFIADCILCETVVKMYDVLQAYHTKLSYCYNKRSISLYFQMPNRTTSTP